MSTATQDIKQTSEETKQTERTRSGRVYRPNVDIIERADELTLVADVAGVSPDDIDINFENGTLTLHGKVRPRQPESTAYLLREYGTGDYYRTFEVNEMIDASRITASCKHGVLTVHLPKAEAAKPRKIAVQGA